VEEVCGRQKGRHHQGARVLHHPPYFDYNWTVHADMPAAMREKLAKAFTDLNPEHA
jgi:ABC-type phosphate/phosphonate transport system substrate-binding protein